MNSRGLAPIFAAFKFARKKMPIARARLVMCQSQTQQAWDAVWGLIFQYFP